MPRKSGDGRRGGGISYGGLTGGLLNAGVVGGAGVGVAMWNRSQPEKTDTLWAMGEIVLGFIVSSGTPEGALRDFALGTMTGALVYLVMRGGR